MKNSYLSALLLGSAPFALLSSPALAQSNQATTLPSNNQSTATSADDEADANDDQNTIVVTGSILRQTDVVTPSPVTTVTVENLDQRGISTVQEGLQMLASNNGPALTNSFTANGAFAGGASAVSLRGLSTNSTLVLFDGLRAAYYPLADDGSRNFVDLNTIPDDIVDRVEVLRDGASAAYGADAIAGVVNIITKREFKGLAGRAEAGISERGDAGVYRLGVTVGHGDLANDGFNAYLSGFYYRSESLRNADRPYPFNSDDLRALGGPNNTLNGIDTDGTFSGLSTAANFLVRPYDATNTTAQGRYVNLGPCSAGTFTTLTDAQFNSSATAPRQVCNVDYTQQYGIITPEIERFGGSGRATFKFGDTGEAYGEVNFQQSTSSYTGFPGVFFGNAPTGINFPQFSTANSSAIRAPGSFALTLPVYVCASGVGDASGRNTGCNATNGRLNPNNPFAAQGQVARLIGRDLDSPTFNQTRSRVYRAAIGVRGDITPDIQYNIGATAMHTDLQRRQEGYVYIANLLTAIAQGTFNFVNPSQNTQAQNDFVRPTNITNASSDLYQLQAVVTSRLAELPGGPLQLGVGGTIYYEAVDAPSGNPDNFGPTQRYFSLNAFGTTGDRTVKAAFAELQAPVLDILEVQLAGRYDSYSSGQDYFSPKAGFKFTPIRQLAIRGTYSKGFRIPSFGEANALPTTGYVTNNASLFNDAYLAQYGCSVATFANCPTYIRSGSYGQTTLASPNLDPEKSRSFTGGVVFEPIRNLSFTVDYYNIKKTGAITQPSNSPALLAYYNGQAIPAGYNVIPDAPDVNFPNATPRVAFVQSQLINANTIRTSGIDGTISFNREFGNVRFGSYLDATYILRLETEFPDGTVERYDGTLGNFNLTAGSGTPKFRGTWLNSIEVDNVQLNATVNYFDGYNLSAVDQGTGYKDGGLNPGYSPTGDNVPEYVTVDLGLRIKATDEFTFTANVLNLFDNLPPIDVVTYGAHLYNPVQGGTGILGRFFKAGVRVGF
ncbi:TonB-dependent receptor domain-containing protein [Novosphingopyxis sp. YJ-S2-01]|uniref:TonB-dependent receptor domain-containing protein n=1 Tax=Novosphingopyxis sp. YJ-S2-01 TaxID=2794021 RepID=UPI0018DD8260|nr:TonB-dependent receptor [Novosphingopyxis sp. YJ-S2-01]